MAKYKISSIPQSLPKNQRGGLFKKKKEKQNSIINYTPPSDETMVQGIEPQNNLGYNFNAPALPTAESFPTYDIGAQDYGRERTAEEVANTFSEPFMWSHGETQPAYDYTYKTAINPLRNPITERSYKKSLERKLGIPYSGNAMEERTIQMPEKFFPDYFAPFTETGEPLACTDGKIAYKGQCITEEAYAIIAQRELEQEDFNYQTDKDERNKKFEVEMNEIKRKNKEWEDYMYDKKNEEYYASFDKSNKKDKIEPYETAWTGDLQYMVPVLDNKTGEPLIDEKTGEPKMQTAEESLKENFLVHRTKNGYTELYPLSTVYDRIVNNGFFNNEFEQYWGLDPKQVQAQVGDVIKQSKGKYDQTVYDKILNRSLERGISPDEAAETFSTKLGYARALKKEYAPKVQKDIDLAYDQFIDETLKNLQKEIGVKEDNTGWVTHDNSKKDDKQNVDFDFYNNFYKDDYDESGKLISREFDPIGQYAQKWIDSAPTQKEKIARWNKVNAIRNKDYSAIGKEAYDESLNAPLSGYMGDPFEGLSNQQITNTYGDRMQTLRSNQYKVFNDKATFNALGARQQAIKSKMEADLAEATGFDKDFTTFMSNRNKNDIYIAYRNALKDPNINEGDKAQILAALKKNDGAGAMDLIMNKEDNFFKSTYNDQLSSLGGMNQYYNMVTGDRVTAGKPAKEIGLGTKTWDCLTNPGDCLYYAMNGRGESMHGDWNISYNDRKEAERRFGTDLGTYKDVNPMSMALDIANTVNPLNWGDEMARGYQANGLQGLFQRGSDLTWDAAATAAMFVPGGQGFKLDRQAVNLAKSAETLNAVKNTGTLLNRTANTGQRLLNSTMKGFNTLERGLNASGMPGKYFVNYGRTMLPALTVDAVRPYGNFHEGIINLSEGNIKEGLGDISMGALGALPYGIKGLNALKTGELTPGLRRIYPEGISYATDAQSFKNFVKPEYRSIASQLHPDLRGGSDIEFKNLQNLITTGYKNIPFNAAMQTGIITPRYQLGRWSAGKNVFKPMSLQEMVTGTPKVVTTSPPASVLLPESAAASQTKGTKKLTGLFKGKRIKTHQTGGSAGNPVIDSLRQLGKKQYGGLPKAQGGGTGIVKVGNRLSNIYTDIAEGGNLFNYAWKSPAMRFDPNVRGYGTLLNVERMPESKAMFDAIQSYTPETTLNKIISKDYELASGPYTGRFVGKVDEQRKEILQNMMRTAKISSEDPMVLSRRIKINDPKLFSLESGIYRPNRPLSFSAGRDAIGNQEYSGGRDRLVMKLDPGQYNIFKNFYSDFTPEDLAAYENFLYQYGAGHTLHQFTTHDMIANNLGMAEFNRSSERELLTPYEAEFGEMGRVKNNFGGYDVIAQPIGLDITQPTWVRPTYDDLVREFDVEHQRKGLGFFNSEGEFINAANQGVVRDVTPDLDMTIRNRSFTPTAQDLINLSKGYRSWGTPYRNEGTIQSIYEGLNQGGNMTMPMVIQYENGLNRILSGNTRMDASKHLGLTPQALFIKAPFKKGGIAMKLSKKEIDKYIEQGYIIEDE